MNNDLHFSTGNDEHDTPSEFFAKLATAVGGFDLDPAASAESDLAAINLRKEDNGLDFNWRGKVFVNPPYSQLTIGRKPGPWITKMADEAARWDSLVVALLPNRTSTQWYQQDAWRASMKCEIEGRLTFAGMENTAPFPSMILVFGDPSVELHRTLDSLGTCWFG